MLLPPSPAPQSHAGKIAIVTGASRGIGRAIALQLARAGADVMLVARTEAPMQEAAGEIRALGRRAGVAVADLREPAAAGRVVEATIAALGGIDLVVNCAGATKRGDFLTLSDEDWSDGFALKLHGAVRLTRAAWPHLKARRGAVMNIAGVGGRTPGPEFTIGGSVNGAMLSFTKALADIGVRDGVRVNAINPGYVRTDRLQTRIAQRAAKTGEPVGGIEARMVAEDEIVRIGEPDDVAHLVVFITSPAGSYLHGALIDLDGGQTKTV